MQGRGGRLDDVEATYRRYFALIREKCRRMLGDFAEADDVAQETFVRLWRTNLRADDRRSVLAWIYKTGTRLAIDRLRERSKMAGAEDEAVALVQLASSSPGGDDALATRRSLEVLARRLPADELEVALLFRLDGLSQSEIAEVARISERTVRRCLQRLDQRVAKLREGILP